MGNLISRLKGDPNLRLLCGFENVPDESQFSRSFAYIAELKVVDEVLDAVVRLAYLQGSFIQRVCRDSTAIPAREKVPRKEQGKAEKISEKRERPPKNAVKKPKAPTVLETQVKKKAAESIAVFDKFALNCYPLIDILKLGMNKHGFTFHFISEFFCFIGPEHLSHIAPKPNS
jgi:hypothetical protein